MMTKKTPTSCGGRQGWCLWQGKQGLLVTTGTAIATEKRRF